MSLLIQMQPLILGVTILPLVYIYFNLCKLIATIDILIIFKGIIAITYLKIFKTSNLPDVSTRLTSSAALTLHRRIRNVKQKFMKKLLLRRFVNSRKNSYYILKRGILKLSNRYFLMFSFNCLIIKITLNFCYYTVTAELNSQNSKLNLFTTFITYWILIKTDL